MNTLKKMIFCTVALGATLGFAGPAAASPSLLVHLPDISALTAEVGHWIADEWQALSKVLLTVPRAVRSDRRAAVTIFEGPNHMIVAATRLPQNGEVQNAALQHGAAEVTLASAQR
jgi:hypothetical protein